jgi:ABC-type lipoprotein export system ATPase subunit
MKHRLLELKGVAKRYPATNEFPETEVLRDIHFSMEEGESVAVVGPSGSGKSTLLNIIGTLDRPTEGTAIFDQNDLASLNEQQLAQLRRQRIGWVFQMHHLLPHCTLLENVLVPVLSGKIEQRKEEPQARALRLLGRVGLSSRLNHRPGQLSGGERQRVAVVRALINEPALLLADEPTGALDRASAEKLADLLVELNREEGVALLVITHAMSLAARMSRVLELRDGTLVPASHLT